MQVYLTDQILVTTIYFSHNQRFAPSTDNLSYCFFTIAMLNYHKGTGLSSVTEFVKKCKERTPPTVYQRNSQNWIKHLDFILLDMISLFLAFFLSYYQYTRTFQLISNGYYRTMLLVLCLLDIIIALAFNSMHNVLHRGYYDELIATLRHVFLVLVTATLLLFALKMSEIYSRLILSFTAVYHCILGYLTRSIWKALLNHRGLPKEYRSMILVCREEDVSTVLSRQDPLNSTVISGLVLTDRDAEGENVKGLPVVANLENAATYICREWVDEVFFFPESIAELEVQKNNGKNYSNASSIDAESDSDCLYHSNPVATLIEECRQMAIPVHIRVPLGERGGKSFLEKVSGFHVVTTTVNYASPSQMMLKRAADIVGGLIGSMCALVILMIVGPIIKLSSPGPILFRQERIGQNGKRFKILKIRSMNANAEAQKDQLQKENIMSGGMMFKMDFDPRIIGNKVLPDGTQKTGIGEFIRRTSLDEFPQFYNVLKGDMSLVGTRPPTVDEWEKYEYHHRARLSMRPGITGLWQVSGRSEITDFEEVVRLDTDYITNWSPGLDVKILFKTIRVLFTQKGAK